MFVFFVMQNSRAAYFVLHKCSYKEMSFFLFAYPWMYVPQTLRDYSNFDHQDSKRLLSSCLASSAFEIHVSRREREKGTKMVTFTIEGKYTRRKTPLTVNKRHTTNIWRQCTTKSTHRYIKLHIE